MAEKTLTDVIPITQFRGVIQDNVQQRYEEFTLRDEAKALRLEYQPIIVNEDYEIDIKIDSTEPDWSLNPESGLLIFDSPPPSGLFTALYFSAQLTDNEITECIDSALNRHLPGVTWNDFYDEDDNKTSKFEELPYIILLAASNGYYKLAAKWAAETRIRTDDVDIHDQEITKNYFRLGEKMEQRYNDASAGIIDVETVTRRDINSGQWIPLPEEVYDE